VRQETPERQEAGAEGLPAEYLASPLSRQPQEPQAKQVGLGEDCRHLVRNSFLLVIQGANKDNPFNSDKPSNISDIFVYLRGLHNVFYLPR
jgi:hypothetical protein